jgi:signal peptidase II
MILGLYDNLALGTRKSIALVASLVASLVILQIIGRGHRLPGAQRTYASVFVGTVLGGMLGNLGERVVHWGVTDYLSFHWAPYWLPPGNVADVALFLAIPMAVPVIVFELQGAGAARCRVRPPGAPRGRALPAVAGGCGVGPILVPVHRGSREGDDREQRSASGWRRSSASAARW